MGTIQKIVDEWDDDNFAQTVAGLFQMCDKDSDGSLRWTSSEVQKFINEVFVKHGIPLPDLSETEWSARLHSTHLR